MTEDTKRCPRCGETKSRSEFRSNGQCTPCGKIYDAEARARKQSKAGGGGKPVKPSPVKPNVSAPASSREISDADLSVYLTEHFPDLRERLVEALTARRHADQVEQTILLEPLA